MTHPALSPTTHPLTRADRLNDPAVAGVQPLLEWDRGPAAQAEAPVMAQSTCVWCERSFRPRTSGGRGPQRFCSASHRVQFFSAARKWALRAIEMGLITPGTIKAALSNVHYAGGPFRTPAEPLSLV